MLKRPVLTVYKKALSPEGRLQAYIARSDGVGAALDTCVLDDGRIRFDVWEDDDIKNPVVRVNIREAQSFHPAIIVMGHELDVLRRVKEHHPSMAEVYSWDLDILSKLNKMGLIDGKMSAKNIHTDINGTKRETYDCRMMETTTAGLYILDRAKERDL